MYSSIDSFLNPSPLQNVVTTVFGALWQVGHDAKIDGGKDMSQNSVLRSMIHSVGGKGRLT